jgi:hypothetical protein
MLTHVGPEVIDSGLLESVVPEFEDGFTVVVVVFW